MSDDMKEAARLIVECMDELRQHDERIQYREYPRRTSESLKEKLRAFLVKHGLDNPEAAATILCTESNDDCCERLPGDRP